MAIQTGLLLMPLRGRPESSGEIRVIIGGSGVCPAGPVLQNECGLPPVGTTLLLCRFLPPNHLQPLRPGPPSLHASF